MSNTFFKFAVNIMTKNFMFNNFLKKLQGILNKHISCPIIFLKICSEY